MAETIPILGLEQVPLSKEYAALIVVLFDLILAFTFWIALLILAPFNTMTTREIDKKRLSPTDFTVQLHAVAASDEVDHLQVLYWAWA